MKTVIAASAVLALAACSSMDTGTSMISMSAPDTRSMAMGPAMVPVAQQETRTMGAANASATKMVGGAPMFPGKDIVDNAVNSKDHTTLVAAVTAAGLVETLKGAGPFTVFAPTNAAFSQLPAGTVDTLLKPENKPKLTQVLTYHVVPGRVDASTLGEQIRAGGGRAVLKTAAGGTLTAMMRGSDVVIADANGNSAVVTIADVHQSNGVIHVVDKVLLPG